MLPRSTLSRMIRHSISADCVPFSGDISLIVAKAAIAQVLNGLIVSVLLRWRGDTTERLLTPRAFQPEEAPKGVAQSYRVKPRILK